MDLLLHFKVNEGDENNINIQEYMLYGDVETKSEKCLVDEGDEVVLTEFPVPEFKNCTLMKKGDEGFYEYKDYRQGENAELAGGRIRVLKNGTDKNIMNWNDDDFEICNKSFNELFSELKPSQTIFIEEVGDVIKTFGILDMKLDDISLKANCLNFE